MYIVVTYYCRLVFNERGAKCIVMWSSKGQWIYLLLAADIPGGGGGGGAEYL